MSLIRENLIADYRYVNGTVEDFSGNSNDCALVTGKLFGKGNFGNVAAPLDDSAIHTATFSPAAAFDAITIVIHADFNKVPDSIGYFLDSGTSVPPSTLIALFFSAANTLTIQENTNTRNWTVADADLLGTQTIIVTKATGSAIAKLYIDGVFHSNADGVSDLVSTTTLNMLSNKAGGEQIYYDVGSILLYTDEKTSTEVVQIHNDVITRQTVFNNKRKFFTPPSVSALSSGSGWNMANDGGQIIDQGPDGNDGTITGALETHSVWQETALKFDGLDDEVDCGNDSSLNYTTQDFGGWMWVRLDAVGALQTLMSRGLDSTDGYFLDVSATDFLEFSTNQAAAKQTATGSTALIQDITYLVGFFSESGGNNRVYLNAVEDGSVARTDPLTSTRNFYFGRNDAGAQLLNGLITAPRIQTWSSRAEFEAAQKSELDRVARKVLYHENFEDAFITLSTEASGAGTPIPSTELTARTNNMFITEDGGVGIKNIKGTTFGSSASVQHDGYSYGTWIVKFTAEAGIRNIFRFVSDVSSLLGTGFIQGDFTGGGNNRIEFSTSAGVLLTTAVSSVSAGDHELKIQVTTGTSNNATVFLDGVQVTAATGSNPFTTNTDNSDALFYMYAPYGGGGGNGAIREVTHHFGIV